MIQVKDLQFCYRGSSNKVLEGLNLGLLSGKIYGLLGKNGVGKSTLLYLMAGLLRPTEGSVTVFGEDAKERKPSVLKDFFIVTEDFDLPRISLKKFLKANASFYPKFSEEVFYDSLKEFDIPTDLKNIQALSMGQKKKVYMSFALATNVAVLLMDEPTNGLDIPSKVKFRKLIAKNMTDEKVIVISTHQVHDVDQLLDHVVILSNDGVLMDKGTDEIADEFVFEYRTPQDMDDALYAEPTLQGNAVIARRGDRQETPLNLELLFDAVTLGKL